MISRERGRKGVLMWTVRRCHSREKTPTVSHLRPELGASAPQIVTRMFCERDWLGMWFEKRVLVVLVSCGIYGVVSESIVIGTL
jgi:hypothetical protein